MSLDYRIEYFEDLESTNKYALELAKKGEKEGSVIIARRQSGGYGRMGRSFYSPDHSGLYMSIILRPDINIKDALLMTCAAAVAVSEAIDEISQRSTGIKWVNDIFLDNKKVCGILCESALDLSNTRLEYSVVGIGVNLYTGAEGFPEEIKDIAGSVFLDHCDEAVKQRLVSLILEKFDAFYSSLAKKEYLQTYREKCFIIGREVTVIRGNERMSCRVNALEEDMRLRVSDAEGREYLLDSGEISIKL